MKTTLKLGGTPRARITKNGSLIDCSFFVPADVIKASFKDPENKIRVDELLANRDGKTVHFKLDRLLWDALHKQHLTPHWYGEWEIDVTNITPNRFESNGEVVTTLQFSGLTPLKSLGGIEIGDSSCFEWIDTRKKEGKDPEDSADEN